MDFDADYDSGKKIYKKYQPTHFFGIFPFLEIFQNSYYVTTLRFYMGLILKPFQNCIRWYQDEEHTTFLAEVAEKSK